MSDSLAKSMAKARALWQEGKYTESAAAMQSVSRPDAPLQALHNKLMATFSAENHQDPQGLLTALQALDQAASAQSKTTDGSAEQYESSVLKLNMAILLVQQNNASEAIKVLEPLFKHIEPMQETVAVRVCLLLMELYLASNNYKQAAKVLHYLETAYGVVLDSPEDKESLAGQNSDLDIGGDATQAADPSEPLWPPSRGSSEPPRPPSRGAESSRITDNPLPGFEGQVDPFTSPPKSDSIGSGVTDEGEIAAVLGRMLDQAGRIDAQAVAQGNRFMEVGGVLVVQLVRILRARLNLALNQLRPARRDIRSILAEDPNSPQGISLKAQLELRKQCYRKAAKILTLNPTDADAQGPLSPEKPSSDSRAGSAKPSLDSQQDAGRQIAMLSNMGSVQHAQHKHNTAALCFSQALRKCAEHSNQPQGSDRSKTSLGHNAPLHVSYSAGMQALQLAKYSTALRCFQVAAGCLHEKPLLWLRMADCCLGVLRPQAPSSDLEAETNNLAAITGSEAWRRVVQNDGMSFQDADSQSSSCQQSIGHAQSACQSQPVVEPHNQASTSGHHDSGGLQQHISSFATQCLHNAIFLSDQATHRSSSPQGSGHLLPDSTPESHGTHGMMLTPHGLPYPSNGHKGRMGSARGAVEEGSAAEAAEQLAMLSIDRSRASSGAMDAAVAAAEELHRQELSAVKACALANLAYLQLQQQQWQQALNFSEQLLQVQDLSSQHQLLAHCYAAEALCNLQSPQQAAQQLHTAVTLQSTSGDSEPAAVRGPATTPKVAEARCKHTPPQMAAYPWYNDKIADLQKQLRQAKRLNPRSAEAKLLGRQYRTQLQHARERYNQEEVLAKDSGKLEAASHALQVAVLVNAASMQANQGQLQQAHDYASKAMHLQPDSQQALLALIYVELCKGNCSKALYLLKQQHLPVQ